jgi:hypothetical protein
MKHGYEGIPNGSRFYKCALQVNTFEYMKRHGHGTPYQDEDSYSEALIEACLEEGIEAIAVTDHYRINSARPLIEAAKAAGLIVFPGFEAVTSEGIHMLCLFDPATPLETVQARIGACGIGSESKPSPPGDLGASGLLDSSAKWDAQWVAAHIASDGGLFQALQAGQARSAIWRHEQLNACSIPGPISDAPENLRPILRNENPEYERRQPIAVLNCQDVKGPDDLKKAGTWCWIKMSDPTIEGLRQAFLDPGSRVRLASDPEPEEHVEFIGIAWETEGFLRGSRLHLNENLNVLIGGRGSGKSTVIESIRYVLGMEPIGEEAKKIHTGIVQGVLRSGTKISLLVQSYRPDQQRFLIERTVPDPPRVIDEQGNVLNLSPVDVVRGVSVFGQNELAELARSPDKLTTLLDRFIPPDEDWDAKHQAAVATLAQSRRDILDCEKKLLQAEERLLALPGLEETLERYRKAGVEAKLKSRDSIIRAEAVLHTAQDRITPVQTIADELGRSVPFSADFLSDDALKALPAADELKSLKDTLANLESAVQTAQTALASAINTAKDDIAAVAKALADEKAATQAAYEQALRDLQKAKIDGDEFIRLRENIERLKPLREEKSKLTERMDALGQKRRNDLAAWEDLKRERFQKLERAARKVSRELPGRLRVKVSFGADRRPLAELLKRKPGGRVSETIGAITNEEELSLGALAQACREGGAAVAKTLRIPQAQAARLAGAGSELPMLIEELDLPHGTEIELNVGPENAPPEWRKLGELSTGQKATALLYLLLLDADAPLVLDQPEDNLDNRFISEGIVPKIRAEKRRRQFIFSTHNANIPVLGDAELIIGMRAVGEAGEGHADVPPENMGSIDRPSVAVLVEEILEGGKDAFLIRHRKYGF